MPKNIHDITAEERRRRAGEKMIRDHKKATRGEKPKSYPVHDANNTVYLCTSKARGEKAVETYINDHKKYWK